MGRKGAGTDVAPGHDQALRQLQELAARLRAREQTLPDDTTRLRQASRGDSERERNLRRARKEARWIEGEGEDPKRSRGRPWAS